MNAKIFLLGSCAVLALGIGTAQAGPCSEQIDNMTKVLASKDAGSGPTSGAGSASTTASPAGQHPPTTAMSQQTQGIATSPEDVRRQTAGQPPAAQQGAADSRTEHPPTAAMSQATQGQASPPGGQPPTAAMSAAVQGQTTPQGAPAMNTAEATAALDRAREFDRQGKEADCMSAIGEAKRLSGS